MGCQSSRQVQEYQGPPKSTPSNQPRPSSSAKPSTPSKSTPQLKPPEPSKSPKVSKAPTAPKDPVSPRTSTSATAPSKTSVKPVAIATITPTGAPNNTTLPQGKPTKSSKSQKSPKPPKPPKPKSPPKPPKPTKSPKPSKGSKPAPNVPSSSASRRTVDLRQDFKLEVPVDDNRVFENFQEIKRQILELCNELVPVENTTLFACLLTTINSELFRRILDKFHPNLPDSESLQKKAEFENRLVKESAPKVEAERRRAFSELEKAFNAVQKASAVDGVVDAILQESARFTPPLTIRGSAKDKLRDLTQDALEWNSFVKGSRTPHLWRIFLPTVLQPFIPATCAPYSTVTGDINGRLVAGVVSLGLELSELSEGKRLVFTCPGKGKAVVILADRQNKL